MAQRETEQLTQIILNALLARALCTLADMGIADQITPGSPRSPADLAKATGTDSQALYRTLRLLASHNVFRETSDGRFDHSPLSQALRSDADQSFRAGAVMFHHMFRSIEALDHSIRTGEPGVTKSLGRPLFELLKEKPELASVFDAGMTAFHGPETRAMLDAYDFSGIAVLADVGGGNGSLIASVLQRYPQMRGILFDLAHVVARARQSSALQALADRCRFVDGSFFETVPTGADAYLLRHVLHDWTDEQCATILGHCHRAIGGRGRLLIVECVVPAGSARSIAKDYDVLMMFGPGGLERTEAQFRALLERSGFRLDSITPTASMVSVIEGTPIV